MKRKEIFLHATVFTVLILAFTSCKKSDNAPSRKDLLTGQWTLTQLGNDTDRNGVPESAELIAAATVGQSAHVNFRGEMSYTLTYTASSTTDTFEGNWSLMNSDGIIHTIYTMNSGTVTDTSNLKIYSLTENTLTVLDESDSNNHIWEVFVK